MPSTQQRYLCLFLVALLVACNHAFVPKTFGRQQQQQGTALMAKQDNNNNNNNNIMQATTLLTQSFLLLAPTVAKAVEDAPDDYEYGAVNAPIGIAAVGGLLAILTALLPLALQGGEEAFEEMRERDSTKWGTGASSVEGRKKSSKKKGLF
mmetsp:Transcript_8097/g.12525  ORF Transcript_8097/g.12525 Transcript_8097/m.12525 type:complete len:151 (+) Transcript_8097:126-578(+)|eukprot:CAMPEP_0118693606 /NCGR_PEP_ID=MMETSP0800-20121206/12009_1 /TAXON_ID=210618 ORGANISM="Striatella unipunctata, Strain CCMP2910" /NCGR_SAMPLE_ID=MMETSP0800 /ASSEMBLY_ACC=CAM_ASM_000638 /LENGTH=150 /DNA_ID=CAMNT_0006591875 /DNA_START=85 /DNA_END=537 /DNA_ORIENTATION=+